MRLRMPVLSLCVLSASLFLGSDVRAEPAAKIAEGPPELRIAVVAQGRTLKLSRYVQRQVTVTIEDETPASRPNVFESAEPRTEQSTILEVQTNEFDLAQDRVVARRIDGAKVSRQSLVAALAKPTPVILVKAGEQIDPRFASVFKPETLVLQWPSSEPIVIVPEPEDVPPAKKPSPRYKPVNPQPAIKPKTSRPRQR